MNRNIITFLSLIIAIALAGCGAPSGASAPPVDISAPIIGKIAATPPDANGNTTVSGAEGAVTGGTIVLAGLDNAATTTGFLWNITDSLISSAYAQSLPDVCTAAGSACVVAGTDGSFSDLVLSGVVIGTAFYVVMIDENGNEIGARSSFNVPASDFGLDGCATASSAGKMVDIKTWNGLPFALFEGDHVSAANNRIQIGSGGEEINLYVPGCYANQLVTYPLDPETLLLAMISPSDKIVWASILNTNGFVGVIGWLMNDTPLAGAFGSDPNYLLLAMQSGTSYSVEKFGLGDGLSYASLPIPTPVMGETLDGILTVDTLGPFNDGGFLGAVVSTGLDGSSNRQFFYTLFNAGTLANLTVSGENIRIGYEPTYGVLNPNAAHDISDVKLGFDAMSSFMPSFLAVADHGNGWLHVIWLKYGGGVYDLYMTEGLAPRDQDIGYYYFESTDRKASVSTVSPRRMALGVSLGEPTAYVLTDEFNLWTIADYPSSSFFESLGPISGAADPVAVAVDDYLQFILVGDATAGVIDMSSAWGGM